MTNHVIELNTVTARPNDTLEITTWPGAQRAGDTAFLIRNIISGEGSEVPAYTAKVTHTNEGPVKVVRVTVPTMPGGNYNLCLSMGGSFTRIVGVRLV